MRGDASAMTTSECRLVSIGVGLGEGAAGRSADAARSLGRSDSVDMRENDGDTDFACEFRWVCVAETLFSSRGALGAVPNGRSRSSAGNSRLVGTEGRFELNPGRTHCILFGPPLNGPLTGGKPGRSDCGYDGSGLGAIGVRSAFGPVGMFAGKLCGEVFIAEPPPLPPRGPKPEGFAPGDASRGTYCGKVALENEGDTLTRRAA
jgi:hypothetical protein